MAVMIPIDLLDDEMAELFRAGDGHTNEGRTRERGITLRAWQGRWSSLSRVFG